MSKFAIFFLLLLSFNQFSFSQIDIKTEEKILNYKNGREVFNICIVNPNFTFNDSMDYYWYNEYSGIKNTKGGCGGKLLHGKYQYLLDDGTLKKEVNYYLGMKDGWHVGTIKNVFDNSGNLVETSTYIEPFVRHAKIYYEGIDRNHIKSEFTCPVGGNFFFGSYKEYYKNGKLKFVGKFSDYKIEGVGFKDSLWTYYNLNGKITDTINYKIFYEKYPNGKIKLKGSKYFDNTTMEWIRDGYWITYKEEGKDYSIDEYENGKLLTKK